MTCQIWVNGTKLRQCRKLGRQKAIAGPPQKGLSQKSAFFVRPNIPNIKELPPSQHVSSQDQNFGY